MASALIPAFREYLIAEGIVRKPSVAGAAHPLWLEPRHGTPAPGEGENATEIDSDVVLAAYWGGGIAPRSYESFIRTSFIETQIRTRKADQVVAVEKQLRDALIDKRDWTMGGLRIIESNVFRELQSVGADEQGYVWVVEYVFDHYADPSA